MRFKYPLSLVAIIFSHTVSANDCLPTAHRTTGTHYEPVTEQRKNIGKGFIVSGQVLSMPDCQPVANAKVAHWQAGVNVRYQDKLRAYLFTDKQGRYQFETEWPNISPPHIHFIVTAKGYQVLETQWIGQQRQENISFIMVLDK